MATVTKIARALEMDERQIAQEVSRFYRNKTLTHQLAWILTHQESQEHEHRSIYINVVGELNVAQARQKSPAIILAGAHFGCARAFPYWMAGRGYEILSIEERDKLEQRKIVKPATLQVEVLQAGKFRARATMAAMRHLKAGGIVHLLTDSTVRKMSRSPQVSWCGLKIDFPLGVPTLAQASGAAIIPYFATLNDQGQWQVEFKPAIYPRATAIPLSPQQREAEILELLDQYRAVWQAEVEKTPGNLLMYWS